MKVTMNKFNVEMDGKELSLFSKLLKGCNRADKRTNITIDDVKLAKNMCDGIEISTSGENGDEI